MFLRRCISANSAVTENREPGIRYTKSTCPGGRVAGRTRRVVVRGACCPTARADRIRRGRRGWFRGRATLVQLFYYCFYRRRWRWRRRRNVRRVQVRKPRGAKPRAAARQTGSAFIFYAVVLINPNAAAAACWVCWCGGGGVGMVGTDRALARSPASAPHRSCNNTRGGQRRSVCRRSARHSDVSRVHHTSESVSVAFDAIFLLFSFFVIRYPTFPVWLQYHIIVVIILFFFSFFPLRAVRARPRDENLCGCTNTGTKVRAKNHRRNDRSRDPAACSDRRRRRRWRTTTTTTGRRRRRSDRSGAADFAGPGRGVPGVRQLRLDRKVRENSFG